MMKRTKTLLLGLVFAVALALGATGAAWAAPGDSEVSFKQNGDAVEVTLTGTGADVSAFSLMLDVDVVAEVPDAVQVGFQFSGDIERSTKIHRATFGTAGDKTRITLYVAGGSDLFAQPLYVGRITLGLDTAKSSGAEVTVDVPVADPDIADESGEIDASSLYALRTVTSAHAEDENGVHVDEPFVASLGDWRTEQEPPADDDQNGGGEGDDDQDGKGSSDDDTYMGPDDGKGPADEGNRNNTNVGSDPNSGKLSQTGDTLMPLVVTLLVVVAAAACVMAFIIIRRRKHS